METVIWVSQALLALAFLAAGTAKLTKPRAELLERMPFVEDFTDQQIKGIGTVEVLGALGVVLPAALDVAPILTPLAACGLAVTMLGATATHLRRGEHRNLLVNAVLLALAVFVAIERFGPHSL